MGTRKRSDSEELDVEFEAHCSQRISEIIDLKPVVEKPKLLDAQIEKPLKTLRKVKRIRIEEKISNTNRTVILERCKNPDTCPANSHNRKKNGKPRAHFHEVHVEKEVEMKPAIKTYSKTGKKLKTDNINCSLGQKIIESFESNEDNTNPELCNVEITKEEEKPSFRMEKIHIDLGKTLPKKEEMSTTSRYTGEPEDLMSNWEAIQDARAASELEKANKINQRKPTTNEFIEEYYKSKEGCSFDRCMYINCKNGRFTTGAHLFRFPQINDPRLVTWMKNAGNPKILSWTWSTIRRAGLCADHFTKDSFFNATRQRLLRTAVPKPFYLEENASGNKKKPENMSQEDLLNVFSVIEKERKNGLQNSSENLPIDLPNDKFPNRDNLVIKYPFEDPDFVIRDNQAKIKNSNKLTVNKEKPDFFSNVMVKTEIIEESESNEYKEILATTSGLTHIKEEPEDDPLQDVTKDFDKESEDDENIRNILAIQEQKPHLCKVIEQFSTKLKNAWIRKHELFPRLLSDEILMESLS